MQMFPFVNLSRLMSTHLKTEKKCFKNRQTTLKLYLNSTLNCYLVFFNLYSSSLDENNYHSIMKTAFQL